MASTHPRFARMMLTLQNLEKLHGVTKVTAAQTSWSRTPPSTTYEKELEMPEARVQSACKLRR